MNLTRRNIILSLAATTASVVLSKRGFSLNQSQLDQEKLYQKFLKMAAKGVQDHPALLYQGIETSPYQNQIKDYPRRLHQKPDGKNLRSGILATRLFQPYPPLGKVPYIESSGLNFLHRDIKQACICLGTFEKGEFLTRWLGRNALVNQEFWSATKLVPLLHVVYRSNLEQPQTNINICQIKGYDQAGEFKTGSFGELARDIVTYQEKIASSNSLAATLKRFQPQIALENWFKEITGNHNLVFRGRYGENPFIDQPQLWNSVTQQVILQPDPQPPEWASNDVSAYDLTRMISLLGWHNYLKPKSQLPSLFLPSLATLIRVMGEDTARLTDLAIQALELENKLDSVVILSKQGNGASSIRKKTEAVYVALVQFIDKSQHPAKLLTLAMTLKGAIALEPRNLDQEVMQLDARMATEVTDIIWRVWQGII